ncbi:HpnE: squalene-associated FAD-dependent desaturase [compost metagenome]
MHPIPTAWHVTRWYADPFSLGAYSALLPGGKAEHRAQLAAPVDGRLAIAGEGVNPENPGMTHGAWDSGLAAAHLALEAGAHKVLVVGAGFAGLAAASQLQAKGVEVKVLEARQRIGGRAHTLAIGHARVDVGAAWLQQFADNPLARKAEELGLGLVETDFHRPLDAAADGPAADIDGAFEALRKGVDRSQPLLAGVERYLADCSPALQRATRHALEARLILEAGLPLEQLAVEALDEPGVGNGDCYPPQGYGQLLDELSRGLDIRLGRPVRRIAWNAQKIRADEEAADFCICTVPIGVLKTLDFSPGLPQPHRQALDHLGMGQIEKVVLQFEERWWPVSASGYFRWFDAPASWGEWLDLTEGTGVPMVAGLIAADAIIRHYHGRSDRQVAMAATAKLAAWAAACRQV